VDQRDLTQLELMFKVLICANQKELCSDLKLCKEQVLNHIRQWAVPPIIID